MKIRSLDIRRATAASAALALLLSLASVAPAFAAQALPAYSPQQSQALQAQGKTVLVDVYAPWCPTCRAQEPVLEKLLKEPEFAGIAALRLDTQLMPETLLGAQGTAAARRANQQYAQLLNYSLSIKRASQLDASRRLQALVGEGPDARALMTEFARNLARESEEDAALMSNRRATIEKTQRVYDLVDAQRQRIDLNDDGNLVFADAQAGEQYNRMIADIAQLILQRQQIEIQRQARTQAALDEIGKIRR